MDPHLTGIGMAFESANNRKVRVLHVASGDLYGGAETMLEHLCIAQSRLDSLEVEVVLLNEGTLARMLRSHQVALTILDESRSPAPLLLHRLIKVVRRFRPDIIHTHRRKENVLGGLAKLICRVPSGLQTAHGAPEHQEPAWKLHKRLYLELDRLVTNKIQGSVVAVSQDLANQLRSTHAGVRIEVIHNGIDTGRVLARVGDPPFHPSPAGTHRIIFLGRLVPVKRVQLLIMAAHKLAESHPGKFTWFILGDGPERRHLEALARKLQLTDIVKFLGFRDDAIRYLSAADIMAMASEHEGLPMSVLEALTLGIPVVAPRVGGLPEVLGANAGILVENTDAAKLADAIQRVAQWPRCRDSRLPQQFEISACVQAYASLYNDSLTPTRSAHDV